MKLVHLVLGLGRGGAETMLMNTLRFGRARSSWGDVCVVSLGLTSHYEAELRTLGVDTVVLDFRRHPLRSLHQARAVIKSATVVSSWLYRANVIAWLLCLGLGPHLIWHVRHADLSRPDNKWSTIASARLCALLGKRADVIAYNGDVSRQVHERIGYPSERGVVLWNGCDTGYFGSGAVRGSLREELDIPEEADLILSAARWHPLKDHMTFLSAFAALRDVRPSAVAVLCGEGVTSENVELVELVDGLGLAGAVRVLGPRDDMPKLFQETDVFVLHSSGEAVPNTLLQAMASSSLYVATDVGDVRRVLPTTRFVVPPRRPDLMAALVHQVLDMPDEEKDAGGKGTERMSSATLISIELFRTMNVFCLVHRSGVAQLGCVPASRCASPLREGRCLLRLGRMLDASHRSPIGVNVGAFETCLMQRWMARVWAPRWGGDDGSSTW